MSKQRMTRTGYALGISLALGTIIAATAAPALAAPVAHHARHITQAVSESDLVSDRPGTASLTDPDLINPWGLALSSTSPIWSANNGSDTATLYSGAVDNGPVAKVPITVPIPRGAPTGVVFNDTTDFAVTGSGGTAPARFIFSSERGTISAWDPTATPGAAITEARVPGAIFKSLALLHTPFGPFLLASDFHHGTIDIFDRNFRKVATPFPLFVDRHLPRGYAPFNVMVSGNDVYVSYAKQDSDAQDEVQGPGLGFVDRFRAFGLIRQRIAGHGNLNAPWGMTIAPPTFGRLAGELLVGNFGDGRINVFDPATGRAQGQVRDAQGDPLSIDGLWSLLPGTPATGGTDAIWFSAGPDNETHGLLGILRPSAPNSHFR